MFNLEYQSPMKLGFLIMHSWLKTNCNCSFVFFLKDTAFQFNIWMKEPLHSTYRYADQYNYTIENELLIMVLQTLCILCRAKLPCNLWEAYSHVGLHWERGKFVELPEDYSWIFSITLWIIGKLCWASSVLGGVLCLWMLETMLEISSQAANEQHNLKKQYHSSSTSWKVAENLLPKWFRNLVPLFQSQRLWNVIFQNPGLPPQQTKVLAKHNSNASVKTSNKTVWGSHRRSIVTSWRVLGETKQLPINK